MTDQTQVDRVDRAIAHMLLHHPWWSSLLLNLRRYYTDSLPTMGTDGTILAINASFVAQLSDSELEAVLAHETAHCALLHPYRRGERDPLRWNIAADGAVNALLEADGFILPGNHVPSAPLGMTTEELYEQIKSSKCPMRDVFDGGSMGNGSGDQDGQPQSGQCPQNGQEQEKGSGQQNTADTWKQAVAALRGIEPAGVRRAVSAAHEPEHNWKAELAHWASQTIPGIDRTWTRPSRRYTPAPGRKREPSVKIALCVDTSGSVDDILLSMFSGEMRGICEVNGIEAYVIACDAAVHAVYNPGEAWTSLPGGGGTDFRPAINKAEELDVDGIVYLTDGCGEYGPEPALPVIWAMSTQVNAPWGHTIHIKEK